MAKKFKQILSELSVTYKTPSEMGFKTWPPGRSGKPQGDEHHFIDKHVIACFDYPVENANGLPFRDDSIRFKPNKPSSYEHGEDKQVYEEEQLDEISADLAGRYLDAAYKDIRNKSRSLTGREKTVRKQMQKRAGSVPVVNADRVASDPKVKALSTGVSKREWGRKLAKKKLSTVGGNRMGSKTRDAHVVNPSARVPATHPIDMKRRYVRFRTTKESVEEARQLEMSGAKAKRYTIHYSYPDYSAAHGSAGRQHYVASSFSKDALENEARERGGLFHQVHSLKGSRVKNGPKNKAETKEVIYHSGSFERDSKKKINEQIIQDVLITEQPSMHGPGEALLFVNEHPVGIVAFDEQDQQYVSILINDSEAVVNITENWHDALQFVDESILPMVTGIAGSALAGASVIPYGKAKKSVTDRISDVLHNNRSLPKRKRMSLIRSLHPRSSASRFSTMKEEENQKPATYHVHVKGIQGGMRPSGKYKIRHIHTLYDKKGNAYGHEYHIKHHGIDGVVSDGSHNRFRITRAGSSQPLSPHGVRQELNPQNHRNPEDMHEEHLKEMSDKKNNFYVHVRSDRNTIGPRISGKFKIRHMHTTFDKKGKAINHRYHIRSGGKEWVVQDPVKMKTDYYGEHSVTYESTKHKITNHQGMAVDPHGVRKRLNPANKMDPDKKKVNEENLSEISSQTKKRYYDRAITDHGLANFAKRQTTGDERKYWARKEKNRKKGISQSYEAANEEQKPKAKHKPKRGRYVRVMDADGKDAVSPDSQTYAQVIAIPPGVRDPLTKGVKVRIVPEHVENLLTNESATNDLPTIHVKKHPTEKNTYVVHKTKNVSHLQKGDKLSSSDLDDEVNFGHVVKEIK